VADSSESVQVWRSIKPGENYSLLAIYLNGSPAGTPPGVYYLCFMATRWKHL